jgi:hypothetical protein
MEKCGDEVTTGKEEITFNWRTKFEGTVEINLVRKLLHGQRWCCNVSKNGKGEGTYA